MQLFHARCGPLIAAMAWICIPVTVKRLENWIELKSEARKPWKISAQRHISTGKHFFKAFTPWWLTILLEHQHIVIKKEKRYKSRKKIIWGHLNEANFVVFLIFILRQYASKSLYWIDV